MNIRTFLLSLLLGAPLSSHAAPAPVSAPAPFDFSAISKAYSDGEFEQGIQLATKAWKSGTGLSRSDSVFLCKYLAVMLGADNAKRENSKYYMNKMLNLDSTETVMDLYASDAIYAIFATVKTEFQLQQKSASHPAMAAPNTMAGGPPPSAGKTAPVGASPRPAGQASALTSNRSKWLWILGGTALVGVGVGLVAVLGSEPEKRAEERVFPVPLPQ